MDWPKHVRATMNLEVYDNAAMFTLVVVIWGVILNIPLADLRS